MKPSRTFLSSVIFLSMGAPFAHAAGSITIGGTQGNIDFGIPVGTVISPTNYGLDAVVGESGIINTLNGGSSVLVTTATDPSGTFIKVANTITWTSNSQLTLHANGGIEVGANLTSDFGGSLVLTADNGSVALNGIVRMNGSPSTSTLLVSATGGITQDNAHLLQIASLATFDAHGSDITLTGPTNNFGSLSLHGDEVSVIEASSTELAGVTARTLGLSSAGAITQTGSIQVDELATFNAGLNAITLGNSANNFGRLSLTGGAITVNEASATDLASVSATSLSVTSVGALTNSGIINVSGAASFAGSSINLGSPANTVSVGSLRVNSTGDVYLRLTSGTSFTGANSAGSLVWDTAGIGTLAFGSSLNAGSVEIRNGSLALSADNQLTTTGATTVGDGTKLDLGTFSTTVGTYNQNGSAILTGTGTATLTASIYNLNGGTVNAKLGTGTLNHTGGSTLLNNTSAAGIVNVTGGTLTLGAINRLADTANVTVTGGTSTLALGNATDTVDSFTLAGGNLTGTGTLTASRYDLNGGTVGANLGTGTLYQGGGVTQLNGISSATAVNINAGTLTFGSADRLANTAALSINGGTLNLVSFNDTVGSFLLNGGTMDGSGTLTAATYDLKGGTVNAKLGLGNLTHTSGSTLLIGSSASKNVKISGGTLTLGSADRLADTAVLLINGGTLDLGNSNETVATFNLDSGTLAGTGTLTAATYGLNGGTIFANLGAGVLTQTGGTTLLNGTSAAATIGITGGTLTLGANDRLLSSAAVTIGNLGTLNLGNFNNNVGSFVLNGGTLGGTGGTLTTANYVLNGGTVNGNLGAGALNQLAGTTTLNGTSSAAVVNATGGTLTLGANNRLLDTAAVTIASTGILNLGNSNDTVGTFVLNGGVLDGSGGTLTAATYALNGGTVNGNLGTGILNQLISNTQLNGSSSAATVNVTTGTLTLGAANRLSDGAAVTIASTGTLNLGNFNDSVTGLTLNGGFLNGTGTLTATTYNLNGGTVNANLGGGTLNQLSNSTLLNGTSGADAVNINGGVFTLGSSNRLSDSAAVTIASAATLNLGNSSDTVAVLTLNGGLLNGTGTLTATSYDLNGGTVNANLGTGTLNQLTSNTLLKGSSAASTVNINGGTLTLGSANRLDESAALNVNAGILDLVSFNDNVGTFALNGGTLNGTGTLTAATYSLFNGTVNANLGTGELTQFVGSTLLNGSSAATSVKVNRGTLTLGASERLLNTANLVVGMLPFFSNTTLDLGAFDETVGTFVLNRGNLNGTGTLVAATYGLNGGTVNANLGAGIVNQLNFNTLLNGTSAAATVNIESGVLTLGASDRLADNAVLTVNSAGGLDLTTFNDTVASFALNGGTLYGTGTLTAATYGLNGGTVNANLGAGILTQTGNTTTLNGTSAAATVAINGGTLTLGASDRLADNAAVTIASLGTLNLGNSNDTVGSFVLNGGILSGTGGTLTTAIYSLNGGTVNGNLGAGTLNQLSNTTVLNGTSAAGIVAVTGGMLTLGTSNRLSDSAAVTVTSPGILNLGSSNDTVGSFILNGGLLNGSGTLTAATYALNGGTVNANLGSGTLTQLSNTTVLNGTSAAQIVKVNGGILSLGASDRLSDSANVTVAGTLNLGNFSDLIGSLTLNGGTVNGSGTLTATSYDLNGGTINANLGTGSLNQISGNTMLNGSSAASVVTVNGGTLTLGASDRLANSAALFVHAAAVLDLTSFSETVDTVTLIGGTINGSGTLSAASYVLYGGTVNANLGSGELNQFTNTTVLNGTSAAGTVNVVGGTLTLGASDRLADTAVLTVASTLNLGNSNDTVGKLILNSGTISGTGTLTALTYDLYGGSVIANLGLGTLNQLSNTTTFNGSSAAGTVNINGGTLALGASDRLSNTSNVTVNAAILNLGTFSDTVGSFALNGGTLNGTGTATLTAATYALSGGTLNANLGAGTLNQLANTTVLNGSSAAGKVNVNGGTLALGASDRMIDSAAITIASAGTLNLGNSNDTVDSLVLNGGTLNGSGTLTATTYGLNGGTISANLGTGTLNQLSNTTTLNGNSASGIVNVTGGTLALGASNRLADSAAVSIASGGTLDLANFNDSVGTFTMNGGSLVGTGTLTASIYTLNGGSLNANLGAGTLNQLSNTSVLIGSSGAATVNINGGTLSLGAADRLSNSAALTIASAGTLNLGTFSDTVGSLVLNGGTINGTSTLTAATYALNGGTVNANLGTGTLTQVSNTTVLNGTSAASIVNINGGTLSLGASDRLGDNAAVTIAGTLNLGSFFDTVGSLTMAGGTIAGTGTISAGNYNLNGIAVNANLGNGTLNQLTGNTVLNGTSAAETVNVNGGTLTLGASGRLNDGAALTVNGATLDLGGFSDNVGTFTLNGGTVKGTGTLGASTYSLNGGTVNTALGQGTLNQLSNTTVINGTSSALTVNVTGGTLALGASDRLSDNAAVTVASTLNLGNSNDTVADFTLNGGTLTGSGMLTANNYNLNGGTVTGNLGAGVLAQLSNTTTLNGTSSAGAVTIVGGTLALGASGRLSDTTSVTIHTGSLDLGSFNDTVASLLITSGSLDGTGTLTAATYQLQGGTVNANLGAGSLTQRFGTTVLNGTSSADWVHINSGALALGSSDRLADTATVTVDGELDLGSFNETVATLNLNGGSLQGTGTLTAANYRIDGGAVNANLGTGILEASGGVLNATSAANSVTISGNGLTLGASERLANTATLTLSGGLDIGSFNETVSTLTLNGGTLRGTGLLTAATYDLNGGSVNARLGNGILNQLSGDSNLNGRSNSEAVAVSGGTLHLGTSDRLSDSASVSISSASSLDLGLNSETVATLRLNGGNLDGEGTFTAARYLLTGGSVNANLGTGLLSQLGETTTLNGTSASRQLDVSGGTLVLGSSDRLVDNAIVAISRLGRLDLGSSTDTIGILNLNEGRLAGNGTLTAATYNFNGGTAAANLGTGTLNQLSRTTTLNGSSAANTINVNGGILTLGASDRLSDNGNVSVKSAELNLGASNDLVRSLTVQSGSVVGNGTLTAQTYQLNNASIIANLGTGSLEQISGVTRLKGASAAAQVKIEGGVLRLMGEERLSDRATIRIVDNGKLKIRGATETVTNYFQQGNGKLVGSGNLAVTGLARLQGGTIAGRLTGNTLTLGDVRVTGKVDGGFVRVRRGDLDLQGTLDSDTVISSRGGLLATGRITGDLKNLGDLTVQTAGKSFNIGGDFTTTGSVTLSLKDRSQFESITADSMKFGGSLVIVNDGSGLGRGKSIQLFDAGSYTGKFDSITTVGFKNQLVFDETTGILTGTRKPATSKKKSLKAKAGPSSASALLLPTAAAAHPVESVLVIHGQKFRVLSISRTAGVEVSASDIQVSSDLVEWSGGNRHITVLRNDSKALVVRDNTPVTQDNKRFIQLKR